MEWDGRDWINLQWMVKGVLNKDGFPPPPIPMGLVNDTK